MAYVNELLYEEGFTGTSFTVTHNLDRLNLDYRIVCSGSSRPDLIDSIEFTNTNERNGFTVNLTSSNTGIIQILDATKYPVNLPTPERINIGSQVGFISGTTLNGDILELNRTGGHPNLTTDLSTIDNDRYVTGATLNSTTLEIGRNGGLSAVTADLSSIDGTVTSVSGTGSVNGLTLSGAVTDSGNLTLGGTLTINDGDWSGTVLSVANGGTGQDTPQEAIDALSRVGVATNEYVLTKDTGTGNALWKAAAGGTDSYVTGATLNATTLELERNNGLADVTVDLAAIDKDRYVTGATLNSTTLELERNGGLPDVTVDLSSIDTNTFVSGGTFNTSTSNIDFVGNSSDTTFSVDMGIIQHDRQVADIPTWSPSGPSSYTDITDATLDTGNLGTNGDYIIIFNANWQGSIKNKQADFQILVGGSAVSISERGHANHKSTQDYTISSSIMVKNVASSTTIKVQGKINGGNLSVQRGTLIIDGIRTTNNIS